MSDVAIRAANLSKQYYIGGKQQKYKTLRESLVAGFSRSFRRILTAGGRRLASTDTIWALKGLFFEIKHGEAVGIIGRNGAGKSTLLKILSRITEPTAGFAEIRGRVRSLLEVGTGFHGELTGRENIYLNGAILGMKSGEIDRKFDEIVAFAEVEKFIDTPVKHYSSGMYLRLAFAVAAHLEPEILLVDEVLAVGDASFQEKCLGKMGDMAKSGRTVLFVSHNMQAISTLTKRCILLDSGQLVFDGHTMSALGYYRSLGHDIGGAEYLSPSKLTGVTRARVITTEPNQIHRFGKRLVFEFEIAFKEKPKTGFFSFQVVDEQFRPIMHLWVSDSDQKWARAGKTVLQCVIEKPRLYMGRYSVVTHVSDAASKEHFETVQGICPFEVVMDGIGREYEWIPGTCTFLEDAEWVVTSKGESRRP